MPLDTRLFYVPQRSMRMNLPMLARYGYTPDSPDVCPLEYEVQPPHNPLTQIVSDTGEVTGPDAAGRYSVVYEVVPLPADVALKNVHAAKLTEIIAGSNACAATVKSRYTELEIDSWAIQQTQAETVLAGGTLPADALLTVLASANGVPVADFAARVMANVQAAEAVTKLVVSQQQGYEARLKAIMADTATDDAGKIAAIQGIVVKYELPEG